MKSEKSYMKFVNQDKLPTSWCGGCGIGLVFKATMMCFDELGYEQNNTSVVSGIGCSGRTAGYFNLDSFHGAHGRAIPVAEGLKHGNPKLNIVVFSGDGDLLGIGGNHLINAAKRGTDITVICIDNEIYGMTGGQRAPTTKKGTYTVTTPYGNRERPVNSMALVRAYDNFYGRSTTFHFDHLKTVIKDALQHKGFSFVDVKSQCIVNNGRRIGFKSAYEMMMFFKENYKIVKDPKTLGEYELGIIK